MADEAGESTQPGPGASQPGSRLVVVALLIVTALVCLRGLDVVLHNRLPQIGNSDPGDLCRAARFDAALRSPDPGALSSVAHEFRDRAPLHPLLVATSGLVGPRLTRTSFWAWNAGFLMLAAALVFVWGRRSGGSGEGLFAGLVLLASPMTLGLLPRPGMEIVLGALLAALAVLGVGSGNARTSRQVGRCALAGVALAVGGLLRWTFFVYVVPLLVLEIGLAWRNAARRPGADSGPRHARRAWTASWPSLLVTAVGLGPFCLWLATYGDLSAMAALAGSEPTAGTLDPVGAIRWLVMSMMDYHFHPSAIPVLVLAGIGAGVAVSRRRPPSADQWRAIAVVVGVLGSHLLAAHKEVRYLYVAMPGVSVLVAGGLHAFAGSSRARRTLAWVSMLVWCSLGTFLWTVAQHREDMVREYHSREPVLAPIGEDLGLSGFLEAAVDSADAGPVGLDVRGDLKPWIQASLWFDAPVAVAAWQGDQSSPRSHAPRVFVSDSADFETRTPGRWEPRSRLVVPLRSHPGGPPVLTLWLRVSDDPEDP